MQFPSHSRMPMLSLRLVTRVGVAFLAVAMWVDVSRAEPYLAVRNGFKCSQCHVNRTGGGKRTDFGFIFTQTALPVWKPKPEASGLLGKLRSPMQNEFVSFGANFRLNSRLIFLDDPPNFFGFDVSEGNLYVEAKFGDSLSFYIDENVAPGPASSREAFGLVSLPANGYLKFGRMLLPYGFRLLDDNAFIREVTGFTYANQDLGIEFGMEPGPLSFVVALSNGTQGASESNRSKQISSVVQGVYRDFRVGSSFSWNDGPNANRMAAGAFGGFNLGRFTALLEFDYIRDRDETLGTQVEQLLSYGELDFLVKRGLNLKFVWEIHDPDKDLTENHRDRFTFGVEAFPLPFTQISLFYYLRRDIPQKPFDDDDTLLLQFHFFF